MESQTNKAVQFRQLHRGPGVLILPNAWDVASARIFEEAGFPAIATTSAGIAFSLGYPDGQCIPREEMLARIGRIARAVHVPVTADIEAGYGSSAEAAAATTLELIQAGAVGMNLEDASGNPDEPLIDLQLASRRSRRRARLPCSCMWKLWSTLAPMCTCCREAIRTSTIPKLCGGWLRIGKRAPIASLPPDSKMRTRLGGW